MAFVRPLLVDAYVAYDPLVEHSQHQIEISTMENHPRREAAVGV
jgi:hypothetical protein